MSGEHPLDRPEIVGSLRRTNERLEGLVRHSIERVLAGSADPMAMQTAYAALRGEVSASEGVDALRTALTADGMDADQISGIEAMYLNALVGV